MFTRFLTYLFITPSYPSAIITVGTIGRAIEILHVVPEDGTIERFGEGCSKTTTTFSYSGTKEQARELIGTVTLHAGDGESRHSFLGEVESRVRQLLKDQTNKVKTTTDLVQCVLQPAALEVIRGKEGRDRSMNGTQMQPIHVVHIMRPRAGRINPAEPTSFPW